MREFNILLTTNNNSGPFDIYYTSEGNNVIAPLVSGNYATNILASQLTDGVDILADYGVSSIYVINKKETCDSIQSLPQTPQLNPYSCINLISKNDCDVAKIIQYTDCSGNTQTSSIAPYSSFSYSGILNTTSCISLNCDDCIITIPDPQYCKYYRITNRCSDVAVDIKYIDCSGTPRVINIGPDKVVIIQALEGTIYNYGGDCGTPPDTEEIPDPNNPYPNETCKDFIAVNNCSLDAVITYTDCDGNIATLEIPAGASIPYSSLSPDYTCNAGDCDCLKVFTPIQTCGFDFSIDGSYIPTPPVAPIPTYTIEVKDKIREMNEGTSKTISITTTNIDPSTILYWKIEEIPVDKGLFGIVTEADFLNFSGSVELNNNKGEFTITSIADTLTEGDGLFKINLYNSLPHTNVLANTLPISLKDTSITPETFNYGVRIYDTNSYIYEYKDNFFAVPPNYASKPNTFVDPNLNTSGYEFRKNGILQQTAASIAYTRLKPTEFPYIADFPFVTSSVLFGADKGVVQSRTESWSGGNQYVYPLNNKVLYWDNTTYKNTNNSDYYLDGYAKDATANIPLGAFSNAINYSVIRDSTYALTGSVSIKIKGNDAQTFSEIFFGNGDQAGPTVFRVFGALEKSTSPNNALSWQKIAFTEMEQLSNSVFLQNPYAPKNPTLLRPNQQGTAFLCNASDHLIWYDFNMSNEVEFNLKVQTDASLSKGTYVRFTLYWQDINGAFVGRDDIRRGSNYLKFTIGGNPAKPSMFSILDKTKR